MIHVQPLNLNKYAITVDNPTENIILTAALLNNITRREVLELMFTKTFAVQHEVNKLMTDRALVG